MGPGGVLAVQQESDTHWVGSDSATSLARQVPTARQVPGLPLTSPRQTLPAVEIQQTSPMVHAGSASEIPVHPPPLRHTPGRPVTDPVHRQPGPVQPGGGVAAQELPSQLEPAAQTPCEVADPSDVPPSETSKLLDPKPTVRVVPGEEATSEKTVPSWETVGATELAMDQLTVTVQSLAPSGITQLAGTENETSVGGFGTQRAPLQTLLGPQAALDGRVASEVPLSESSKTVRPKSRVAVNPGWAARVETCVPS